MRKLLLAGALVAALAVPSAAQAKSHTLRLNVAIPNANVLTNPPGLSTNPTPPPPGAYVFAGVGTFTGGGGGRVVFSGTAVSGNETLIQAVLTFRGGSITALGLSTDDARDKEYSAITGGTRKYRGVRGDAVQTNDKPSDDPNGVETFTLTLKYQ
jgi:hypothetical protein